MIGDVHERSDDRAHAGEHAQHDTPGLAGEEALQLDDVARVGAHAELVAPGAAQDVAQLARDPGELGHGVVHAVARVPLHGGGEEL